MKLLKFDVLYPSEYLLQKQNENAAKIKAMDFDAYNEWLMGLRMGFYDLFSREAKKRNWEAMDFYFQDDFFVTKLAEKYNIRVSLKNIFSRKGFRSWKDKSSDQLIKSIRFDDHRNQLKKHIILRQFIEIYKPDTIFLREPCQVDNHFWKAYKGKIFIATLIGCNIGHPVNWQPHTSDMIFTITKEFVDFFRLNNMTTHFFEYGFDPLLLKEVKLNQKKYDVSFVGLLGTADQQKKTELLEYVASRCNLKWWGPKGAMMQLYPHLLQSWQGIVAGKEMFQVYASSRIVVNDYVHSNGDNAVNLRLTEVLGVGTFLLTRRAENITLLEENNILRFYDNPEDCVRKIEYYLSQEEEREEIAMRAKSYVNTKYNYIDKLHDFFNILENSIQKKAQHN